MSFQGFIGGNLLVTGGVIARHIAANQIDGDKITFVEASGRNLRADTLEIQAANVIGTLKASQIDATGITVDAINVTGTITADQVQDKLKAPVRLHDGFTSPGLLTIAAAADSSPTRTPGARGSPAPNAFNQKKSKQTR